MSKTYKEVILPDESIMSKILLIRGKRIMIDKDLAELYCVPTKRLNEQVKRNERRFPEDFMFQLTAEEKGGGSRKMRPPQKPEVLTSPQEPRVRIGFTRHDEVAE